MSLSSLSFIGIYFPVLFILYYLPFSFCKKREYRNGLLLLASLGLYGAAEPVYIFLLVISVCVNYLLVEWAVGHNKKSFAVSAVIVDVLVLVFFKYINQVLRVFRISDLSFAFPVGLSYFTFQEISYAVDSFREKRRSRFFEAALYITGFMRIVSGPLGFYSDCVGEIEDRDESKENIFAGIDRFVIGLVKKILIADSLEPLVTICFNQSVNGVMMAWIGVTAFALELYFDFSGYTDMAVGMGRIFGFHINENFHFPYAAKSVCDFWKRWHISLTKWFTKYVYIPLGGSRVSVKRHIFNLFVVWVCTGLWHGSKLTFLVWAMIYFVLQTLEKYTGFDKKLEKVHLNRVYTLLVVLICWVFFRSGSVSYALSYIGSMFGMTDHFVNLNELRTVRMYMVPLVTGAVMSLPSGEWIVNRIYGSVKLNNIMHAGLMVLFIMALIILLSKGYSAPLYAGF